MTDRQKRMIEYYIPSPKDPTLLFGEYYLMYNGRSREYIRKVRVGSIYPHSEGYSSWNEYEVFDCKTGARIDAGYGDYFRGFKMSDLYDNKEDCKDRTHYMYDDWEELREIQARETT